MLSFILWTVFLWSLTTLLFRLFRRHQKPANPRYLVQDGNGQWWLAEDVPDTPRVRGTLPSNVVPFKREGY